MVHGATVLKPTGPSGLSSWPLDAPTEAQPSRLWSSRSGQALDGFRRWPAKRRPSNTHLVHPNGVPAPTSGPNPEPREAKDALEGVGRLRLPAPTERGPSSRSAAAP